MSSKHLHLVTRNTNDASRRFRACTAIADDINLHMRHPKMVGTSRTFTLAFTLIEMMLVVLIVGIFAALAVPYAGTSRESQLPSAMRLLEADLAFVQAHAISHQDSPCVMVFDVPGKKYTIALAATPLVPLTHPGDNQPYVVHYGKNRAESLSAVSIKQIVVGDDSQLSFGSLGQLDQTAAATITLTDGNADLMITLDPITGLGTITKP